MKTGRENETEWQKEKKSNDRQESVMAERKITENRDDQIAIQTKQCKQRNTTLKKMPERIDKQHDIKNKRMRGKKTNQNKRLGSGKKEENWFLMPSQP